MSKSIASSVKETLGMKPVSTLEELFIEQLQDLHSAETQLIDALPKMAEAGFSRWTPPAGALPARSAFAD